MKTRPEYRFFKCQEKSPPIKSLMMFVKCFDYLKDILYVGKEIHRLALGSRNIRENP
jgi:hypothetical protein